MSATLSRCAHRSKSHQSVYEIVTGKILEALENGVIPWRRPWNGEQAAPRSASTGRPYRGINAFLLALQADSAGYESPYWLTYKQAESLGGHVRKGERSTLVVFWKEWETEDRETGEEIKVPVLRYFNVFHASQCDVLGEKFTEAPGARLNPFEPIELCQRVVASYADGPAIEHSGFRACYRGSEDRVFMPRPERFERPQEYYSTLFHELAHSTGHATRLARKGITEAQSFGSDPYGREELIAEMGAAFLCGHCGIETATLENSSAYISSWLRTIRQDARLVVQSAAAAAQRAADWVLGQQEGGDA
jgi:antirestriction protein ArdC